VRPRSTTDTEFGRDAGTEGLGATMPAFVDEVVHPAEAVFHDRLAELDDR
jgi:acyl-CoA dehydrogenase